jgi:uncharacterized OsmC-like protein
VVDAWMPVLYKVTAVVKSDTEYEYFDGEGNEFARVLKPPEHYTAAVVGCIGLTMHAILNKMKVEHQGIRVAGTATRTDGKPGMVESIELHVSVKAPELSEEQVERVKELTEKYCLIAESIRKGTRIDWVRVAFE